VGPNSIQVPMAIMRDYNSTCSGQWVGYRRGTVP